MRSLLRSQFLATLRPLCRPLNLTFAIATWIPMYLFLQEYYVDIMPVNGPSMHPALNRHFDDDLTRDWVLVWRHRARNNLQRGSVVMLWSPLDPERRAVKRVTAVEGDCVFPASSVLSSSSSSYPLAEERIPSGHVWVEGDNADPRKSKDSRMFGPVPRALIEGEVMAVVWPWRHAALLRWQDWKANEAHSQVKTHGEYAED